MLPEKGYARVLVIIVYGALILFGLYVFFRVLLAPLSPFIAAFLITSVTRPAVKLASEKLHLPQKFAVVLFTVLLICLLSLILYFSVSRLLSELVSLTSFLTSDSLPQFLDLLSERIIEFLESIPGGKLSSELAGRIADRIRHLDSLLMNTAKNLFPSLMNGIMSFLSFFPTAVVFIILMFVAMFYIGCDYESIVRFISIQLPEKVRNAVSQIIKQFYTTAAELFKAYFLITIISFAELLTGFLIIGIEYSITLAAVVAIIDMLPVLGTGTVLVPWGLISLILGDSQKGIGLLVLYGVITVIRQIIEPKIVGGSIGLYPLVTLISMYCGVKLLGFIGLFLAPLAVIIIKSLNEKGVIHLYKNPVISDKNANKQRLEKFEQFRRSGK